MLTPSSDHLDMELALALMAEDLKAEEAEASGVGVGDDNSDDLAFALSLQEELNGSVDVDGGFSGFDRVDDHGLAMKQAETEHEAATNLSVTGRAWNFVSAVLAEHHQLVASDEANKGMALDLNFETIGVDDMLFTTERLLETQALFDLEGKDTLVDIGYHYTRSENLEHIRANGLLTKADRERKDVRSNFNGSAWGDGVYSGNNPFAFANYGDTGLLVARLKGKTNPACRGGRGFVGDTAVVGTGASEMVILRQSVQCVPLLRFRRLTRPNQDVDAAIWHAHSKLQALADSVFNGGTKTAVSVVPRPAHRSGAYYGSAQRYRVPPRVVRPVRPQASLAQASISSQAPVSSVWVPDAKKQRSSSPPAFSTPSCDWYQDWKVRNRLREEPTRELRHSPCHSETFQRGDSSLESMRVMQYSKEKLMCDGADTLIIVYCFKSGDCVSGLTHRRDFLPDTPESRALVERLKGAFFSGKLDAATWSLLPHRANPYGAYENFLADCTLTLDGLGGRESEFVGGAAELFERGSAITEPLADAKQVALKGGQSPTFGDELHLAKVALVERLIVRLSPRCSRSLSV